MVEQQFQHVASGLPGRRPGTVCLELLHMRGQLWIIGHNHSAHGGRDSLRLLAAKEGCPSKTANLPPVVGGAQSMHAVFDQGYTMPACQVERSIKVNRDTKGMLQ